jgi:hypothetical protein
MTSQEKILTGLYIETWLNLRKRRIYCWLAAYERVNATINESVRNGADKGCHYQGCKILEKPLESAHNYEVLYPDNTLNTFLSQYGLSKRGMLLMSSEEMVFYDEARVV